MGLSYGKFWRPLQQVAETDPCLQSFLQRLLATWSSGFIGLLTGFVLEYLA